MDIAVMLRIERFNNPFFTGASAREVLHGMDEGFYGYAPVDLQQEVQSLMNPVAPFGAAIVATVEDLEAQTRIKVQHARAAVATTFDLLGFDLLQGSLWLDVRSTQDSKRRFGTVPTAAWAAFRQVVPLAPPVSEMGAGSAPTRAAEFLHATAATSFYGDLPAPSREAGGSLPSSR
jgi:histidine ammonia-lyase